MTNSSQYFCTFGTVCVVNGYGHWVVENLDYFIMLCSTILVTVHFGSFISTFCSIFVNYIFTFICVKF